MTKNIKDRLITTGLVASLVASVCVVVYIRNKRDQQMLEAQEQRKEAVCPSFLSIARSMRDTLIVMKNEPLCDRYVLDNLK